MASISLMCYESRHEKCGYGHCACECHKNKAKVLLPSVDTLGMKEKVTKGNKKKMLAMGLNLCILVCMIMTSTVVYAGVDAERICKAIYFAEGGAKTRHPYGILKRYKHTSPKQACLNTVRHQYQDWVRDGKEGEFLTYLASKYCPVGSDTDNGTCVNWERNVRAFLWTKN